MSKRKRKKVSTELVTATVTELNHEGRGIARVNGKATFLFAALAGEIVQFQYSKYHRQYDEGTVVDVIEKSTDRVVPPCKHFGVCGGCSLQHMNSDAQRTHKQAVLLEHLQHQANCAPAEILSPLFADAWEYRRRARLSVRFVPKKDAVLVGFRERGSSYVARLESCDILHPSIGKKIKALGELLMQCEMKSHIAQIEVAVGDNASAIVVRHLVALPKTDIEKLILFARENNVQLYFQPEGTDSIHAIYPENPERLFYEIPEHKIDLFRNPSAGTLSCSQHPSPSGTPAAPLKSIPSLLGFKRDLIKIYFKPSQFTQINQAVNLKMISRAIELLDLQKTDRVLDLFCGIGNFSLPIAQYCAEVMGIEGSENAITQAQNNAKENNIHNTQFFTQDLSTDLSHAAWSQNQFDKIVLDPPRVGAKELMPYFATWKPKRIVYISCNPITLARDTKDLLQLGYRLEKAGVMDMFPHTEHVEAIALFVR